MEVVKFTDYTYQSLSDDTVIMSSSNINVLKGNNSFAQHGKPSGESSGRASL